MPRKTQDNHLHLLLLEEMHKGETLAAVGWRAHIDSEKRVW